MARRGLPAKAAEKTRPRGRFLRRLVVLLVVVASAVAIANFPTTTRQGVNHVVTTHSLPLFVKALDFVDRDVHYRRQAAEITAGAATDEAKAKAVFDWTRAHIHNTPAGLPVVDDHPWHIIIRGYGQSDQKADVFTVLLSYAGVPAYFIFIGPQGHEMALSLAKIEGRWRVADVDNGVLFRSRDGRWATAEDLATDTAFLTAQGPKTYGDSAYAGYFEGFHPPDPPDLTRAGMQVPGARTWFWLRRLAGFPGREWEMRPASRQAGHSSRQS